MKKLLVILLLLFPLHGAGAGEHTGEGLTFEELMPDDAELERKAKEAKERMECRKARGVIIEKCGLKAAKAKTDTAANLIYTGCMRKHGLSLVSSC